MKTKSLSVTTFALLFLSVLSVRASEDSLTTSVFSKVSNGYVRMKLPDGTFKRETYAISNGGYSPGIGRNESIDDIKFPVIAGVVARHLARQNYFLAQDSKSADILLVVQWGQTIPFNDGTSRLALDNLSTAMNNVANTKVVGPSQRGADGIQSDGESVAQVSRGELEQQLLTMQMSNDARNRANEKNAGLLGYMDEINETNDMRRFAGGGTPFDDLISDVENPRYYVIITAYDFRSAVQEKKQKLLWVTRVSIQAQGNRFDERLTTMMANASRQFGQDSKRLIRQYQQSPRVDLGELKFLAVVPDGAPETKPIEKK